MRHECLDTGGPPGLTNEEGSIQSSRGLTSLLQVSCVRFLDLHLTQQKQYDGCSLDVDLRWTRGLSLDSV